LTISYPSRLILHAGLTAVLLAYFLPWLPHPAAGLRFIGLEMGEWVKFLPLVQAGQIRAGRDLFYLPPITLGLLLALLTSHWPNNRWQTWAMRGLAVLVSLLAFPAIEAIRLETPDNYLPRLQLIGLVGLVALLSSLGRRLPLRLTWLLLLVTAVIGAILPTWAFLAMRPAIEQVILIQPGIGPGVWLNLAGHLTVTAVLVYGQAAGQQQSAVSFRSNVKADG
jgi:hypothetical protein